MNWDAIGAVGEIIGAVAVVASVGYLATQIKKQTEESRLSATRELATHYQDVLNTLVVTDGLMEIYLKGVQDYRSLPNVDRLKVALIFQKTIRLMEQQIIHTKKSGVDDSYFLSTNLAFEEFLTFPGVQEWWGTSKHHFEPEFRAQVEKLLTIAKERGYNSTFAPKAEAAT
ncbi:MAG: hypothetical protein RIC85_01525 [Gammaproteobacteria bacterium]